MAKFKFKLPKKLTRKQERAIDSTKPIFLTGVPGSGKTVVATMRLKNSENGILFTYGKLLSKAIATQVNDSSKRVTNIHKWYRDVINEHMDDSLNQLTLENIINYFKSRGIGYEQIIVDEGQDIIVDAYRLLVALSNSNVSVGADNAQQISYNKCSTEEDILSIIGDVKKIELDENFRNSYSIFNFARQFVPNNPRVNDENMLERLLRESGEVPVIYKVLNRTKAIEVTKKIINANPTDNIGILCKNIDIVNGYAYALSAEYEISAYHYKLSVPEILNNILVTTVFSAKGMEFDIVIIVDFHNMSDIDGEIYFVASTRAKTELYLLCENNSIPEQVQGFDPESYNLIEYKG